MLLQIGAHRLVGVVCLVLLFSCCTCNRTELPSGITNKFYWMPPRQQEAEFEKYDFEAQYRVYIYGCQHIEPPDIGLAAPIARQGGRIVQPLKAKLEVARDDRTIRDIVRVFRVMNDLGAYDVSRDESLKQALLEKVSSMKGDALRIVAQYDVLAITTKTPKSGDGAPE